MARNLIANVAVRFMLRLALLLDVAQRENFDVRIAKDRLSDSAKRSFASPIAMAQCRRCKDERRRFGFAPRELVRLPPEVTQDTCFRRKGLPVVLCEHCDGSAVELAQAVHRK